MYECWECGEIYDGKKVNGKVKVYDEETDEYVTDCPNCGGMEFVKLEEEDY